MRPELFGDDWIRVRLLMHEAVQKDLGLSTDQVGKLEDLVKIAKERSREFGSKENEILPSRQFTPEEFEARMREYRAFSEHATSVVKELQAKALATLTPGQMERLRQIQLQAAIPAALERPEIVKALGISEEQRGRVRAMRDRLNEKRKAEFPRLGGLNPKERRQKFIETMKEWDRAGAELSKQVLDVLTPEQRAKFDKLFGKKIEVKWPYDKLVPEDAEF